MNNIIVQIYAICNSNLYTHFKAEISMKNQYSFIITVNIIDILAILTTQKR
jgi:hypothetical protein